MIYINNAPFGDKSFPNGETIFDMGTYYVKDAVNEIKLVYESDADIFKLIVAKKCLDEQSKENRVDYGWDEAIITLTIAYMPYSRMDRQMSSMAFSLRYVADIINSLNFDSVTILTPHSNVTPALINNVKVIYDAGIQEVRRRSAPDYVFYPDNGACKSFGELKKFSIHTLLFIQPIPITKRIFSFFMMRTFHSILLTRISRQSADMETA